MYSIIKNTRTNEYHIFKSYVHSDKLDVEYKSICQKCTKDDLLEWVSDAKHLSENDLRIVTAQKGNQVCSCCVGYFYAKC